MTEEEAYRILGQRPHCDPKVLHAPGECEYCDGRKTEQAIRVLYGINFTGHKDAGKQPCPAERVRPIENIERWYGNRPTEGVPAPDRWERVMDDED